MIANWLTGLDEGAEAKPAEAAPVPAIFPAKLQLAFDRTEILRYGENSHQQRRLLPRHQPGAGSIAAYTQLQGKELSYNNIADSDAAWECVKSFDAPACVIIKHANPCGVAIDGTCSAPMKRPSRPTRPRPSAASSPSTAKSASTWSTP
jgi:phosphoribosylaminoimidazolecarboxamide formyltransferase/IMP cyclohydrolase